MVSLARPDAQHVAGIEGGAAGRYRCSPAGASWKGTSALRRTGGEYLASLTRGAQGQPLWGVTFVSRVSKNIPGTESSLCDGSEAGGSLRSSQWTESGKGKPHKVNRGHVLQTTFGVSSKYSRSPCGILNQKNGRKCYVR